MIYQNHKSMRSGVSILLILGMFQLATAKFTATCISCGGTDEYRFGSPEGWGKCRRHKGHTCQKCTVRSPNGKLCRMCYAISEKWETIPGFDDNAWEVLFGEHGFVKAEDRKVGKNGHWPKNWIRKDTSDERPDGWMCPNCEITVTGSMCTQCTAVPTNHSNSNKGGSSSQQCDEKVDEDDDVPAHDPSKPYHEEQRSNNCGAHAVRTILASLGVEIPKLPQNSEFQKMCDEVEKAELAIRNVGLPEEQKHTVLEDGFAHGGKTGMWSKEVLDKVLKHNNFELCDQRNFAEAKAFMVNITTNIRCNGHTHLSKHWYAIVSHEGSWWNADSCNKSPRLLGHEEVINELYSMPTAFRQDDKDFVEKPDHKGLYMRYKYQILSIIPKRAEAVRWRCKRCDKISERPEICGLINDHLEPCQGLRADGEVYEESGKALQPVKAKKVFPDGRWECGSSCCNKTNSDVASVCLCGTPRLERRRLTSRLLS